MVWFIYTFSLIIPITLAIVGFVFLKHAPKDINATSGWRTKRAIKNQETWDFANKLAGKCSFILGILEIIMTIVILLIVTIFSNNLPSGIVVLLTIIQCFCFIFVYRYVENKIEERFS